MKKVCLSLLLSMLFLCQVKANDVELGLAGGPKVSIKIQWGRIPTCTGWGICGIEVGVNGLGGSLQIMPSGDGSGGGGVGSWLVSIPKQNLIQYYPDLLDMFDGKSTVTFEDTYVLPQEVKKAMGSLRDLIIQGNSTYPLKYENGEFIITFPL